MAADTPSELACLLEAAWQLQPGQRPTAAQLEAKLQSLADQLEESCTGPSVLLAEQQGTADSRVTTGKRGVVSRAQCDMLAALSQVSMSTCWLSERQR